MALARQEFERRALALRERPDELTELLEATLRDSSASGSTPVSAASVQVLVEVVQGYEPDQGRDLAETVIVALAPMSVDVARGVALRFGIELSLRPVQLRMATDETKGLAPPT